MEQDALTSPARPGRLQQALSALRRPVAWVAIAALALMAWQWIDSRSRMAGLQEEVARRLVDRGFRRQLETDAWDSTPGGHVLVREGAVVAWRIPETLSENPRFAIVGAHTDSPSLKLKPQPTASNVGYAQAAMELYGGLLLNSWLDREFGLAGRLTLRDGTTTLVRTPGWLRIPQLAPHMDRSVNESLHLDRQHHMKPLLGLTGGRDLMTAIADVIAAADRAGIVHRDLKPENVLVVDPAGGEVRVIDWGIAHHPVGPRLTLENLSLGTPTYIAPEQALGRPVDGRADVYALGVIAYEAVVGRPPFASDHALAMVLKHLLEAPPPVRAQRPDVPCCLAALIEAMLAKDPEHRPTAREVRARLAPLQAGAAPVACDHDDALGAYCELVVTDAATEDAPAFEVLPPPATTWQRDPAWAGRRAPRAARAAAIVDV